MFFYDESINTCLKMTVDKISDVKINLQDAIKDLDYQIQSLSQQDPLFGFISSKYIRCGRENCRCKQSPKSQHGPYFYLRLEPEYRFTKYLGKRIPDAVEERIIIGSTIKELERKRKKLSLTLEKIDNL